MSTRMLPAPVASFGAIVRFEFIINVSNDELVWRIFGEFSVFDAWSFRLEVCAEVALYTIGYEGFRANSAKIAARSASCAHRHRSVVGCGSSRWPPPISQIQGRGWWSSGSSRTRTRFVWNRHLSRRRPTGNMEQEQLGQAANGPSLGFENGQARRRGWRGFGVLQVWYVWSTGGCLSHLGPSPLSPWNFLCSCDQVANDRWKMMNISPTPDDAPVQSIVPPIAYYYITASLKNKLMGFAKPAMLPGMWCLWLI